MNRTWVLPDGKEVDLNYFISWRPWLWAKPVASALEFISPLAGKHVLEIGGHDAKLSCLFAMMGANVTMVDKKESLELAEAEVAKWGVSNSVRLIKTQGGFEKIAGEKFDVIFTKSVLYCIEDLPGMLDQIDSCLATGGKIAFIENYRGGNLLMWMRRLFIYRGRHKGHLIYFNINPWQIQLFRDRFSDLTAWRHLYFIYTILGRKKPAGRI